MDDPERKTTVKSESHEDNATLAEVQTTTTTTTPQQPILFDIFHGGQPVEAVVVGSKVTMSFTPFYAIPPAYMTVAGCQIEPIGSLYEWERDPLPIVKDGCQFDGVGLICPPEKTNFGIRIVGEAFRYQSTAEVLYTCLVRICPYAPCPQNFCPAVEGCDEPDRGVRGSLTATDFRRNRRQTQGLARIPFLGNNSPGSFLSRQINLPRSLFGPVNRPPIVLQQYLLALAGDHVVSKRLIVINSENELQYFLRTGNVPNTRLSSYYGLTKKR